MTNGRVNVDTTDRKPIHFCPACGVDIDTHKNLPCIGALLVEFEKVNAELRACREK